MWAGGGQGPFLPSGLQAGLPAFTAKRVVPRRCCPDTAATKRVGIGAISSCGAPPLTGLGPFPRAGRHPSPGRGQRKLRLRRRCLPTLLLLHTHLLPPIHPTPTPPPTPRFVLAITRVLPWSSPPSIIFLGAIPMALGTINNGIPLVGFAFSVFLWLSGVGIGIGSGGWVVWEPHARGSSHHRRWSAGGGRRSISPLRAVAAPPPLLLQVVGCHLPGPVHQAAMSVSCIPSCTFRSCKSCTPTRRAAPPLPLRPCGGCR